MHIAKSTPDQLVLTDSGATLRMFGVFMLAMGVFWIYTGTRAGALAALPLVIGTFMGIGGAAMVILPGRVIAAFDKPSHTLVLTRRTIHGYTRDEIDFSKIADVITEKSYAGRGGPTYRVAIALTTNRHIPLTSWYSSSPLHWMAAEAAEKFLGLDHPAAADGSSSAATAPTIQSTMASLRTGLLLTQRQHQQSRASVGCLVLFAGIFFTIGATMSFTVWNRLTYWQPVAATVVSSTVASIRGSKGGTTYRPDVTYKYVWNGTTYFARQVTVLQESRSGRWAYDLVRRYPPGAEVIAYANPQNPSRAYLLHEWTFFPVAFVGVPIVILAFAFWTMRQMSVAKRAMLEMPGTVAPRPGTT